MKEYPLSIPRILRPLACIMALACVLLPGLSVQICRAEAVVSADPAAQPVTVQGELLREELGDGIWNLRAGSKLYDLHGRIKDYLKFAAR